MAKWIMPSKTTVNWLLWCYLFIACFDWKICILRQTAVRVYYILNEPEQLNQNQQFKKHLAKIFKKSDDNETLNHPSEMKLTSPLPPVIHANNLNQEKNIKSEPASTNQTQLAFPKKNDTISIKVMIKHALMP